MFHRLLERIETVNYCNSLVNKRKFMFFEKVDYFGIALKGEKRLYSLFEGLTQTEVKNINSFHNLSNAQIQLFFDLFIIFFPFHLQWGWLEIESDFLGKRSDFWQSEIVQIKVNSVFHWNLLASHLLNYCPCIFLPSFKSFCVRIQASPLYAICYLCFQCFIQLVQFGINLLLVIG